MALDFSFNHVDISDLINKACQSRLRTNCLLEFETEEEALKFMNHPKYGLAVKELLSSGLSWLEQRTKAQRLRDAYLVNYPIKI